MAFISLFEVIGPNMVGPSSSHTAGAASMALLARKLFPGEIKEVHFTLYGSFAKTYRGHGTDRALMGGMLGFETDDSSLLRQHINLPHTPDIFVGFRDRFCSFAILIETAENSVRYVLQHNGRPQIPIPPRIFVSSLTPICLSSILVRNTAARSFTSSRKSIRPSAVK